MVESDRNRLVYADLPWSRSSALHRASRAPSSIMATKICNARAAAMTNIGIIVRLLLPFFLNRLVTVAGMSDNLFDEEEELPSLFPFRTEDYVGFTVAVLGLILAAGGGIGGGGILVPTYILLLDFPVKHAIP
eukprot:CAMPEP_0172555868 /NCGR_PEP_ID=MMETSP1067-20121228/60909_1 /TAXON_ID=265564 ORGANISM="Thalassiosira punctigera, Strain Tpunct2005C2" /NCGR_SAMPLE_ID=MMETSP1067 /ASSEMBLY_ACC=CAM_ASM_000444 /LENGTH=132 /DNA_ID=CAMNT_0013344491 /DNA_START=285 /DNA_END=680 /DNA_ORIENTATION=-